MLTPSTFSKRIVSAWLPAYLVLALHGATIANARDFVEIFIFYPLLCGIPLAIFAYYHHDDNEEFIEATGIPETPRLNAVFIAFILLPLGFVMFAMLQAQQSGSYSDVAWIVIIFGGLILGEIGKQLKFRARDRNS